MPIRFATFWPVAFTAKSWYIMRTSSGFDGHSLCKVASKSCIVFGPYHRFVATKRQLNVFFHVCLCHFAGFPSYNTADMKRHARTSVRFRDQKVAGSNPVTSTIKDQSWKQGWFFMPKICPVSPRRICQGAGRVDFHRKTLHNSGRIIAVQEG